MNAANWLQIGRQQGWLVPVVFMGGLSKAFYPLSDPLDVPDSFVVSIEALNEARFPIGGAGLDVRNESPSPLDELDMEDV